MPEQNVEETVPWERQLDVAVWRLVGPWPERPLSEFPENWRRSRRRRPGPNEPVDMSSVPAYSTDAQLALELANEWRITMVPVDRSGLFGWRGWHAGRCNASGTNGEVNWVGMTSGRHWQCSKSLTAAVCLAVLAVHGVRVPKEPEDPRAVTLGCRCRNCDACLDQAETH